MNDFVQTLSRMDGLVFLNGSTNDEIFEAEESLGLSFSDEYTSYLEKYAIASFDGHEFTGIIDSERLNVVSVTKRFRNKYTIPDDLYVVEDLYIDKIVIWQNAKGEVFETIDGSAPKKIAESLVEYLENY